MSVGKGVGKTRPTGLGAPTGVLMPLMAVALIWASGCSAHGHRPAGESITTEEPTRLRAAEDELQNVESMIKKMPPNVKQAMRTEAEKTTVSRSSNKVLGEIDGYDASSSSSSGGSTWVSFTSVAATATVKAAAKTTATAAATTVGATAATGTTAAAHKTWVEALTCTQWTAAWAAARTSYDFNSVLQNNMDNGNGLSTDYMQAGSGRKHSGRVISLANYGGCADLTADPTACTDCRLDCGYALMNDYTWTGTALTVTGGRCVNFLEVAKEAASGVATPDMAKDCNAQTSCLGRSFGDAVPGATATGFYQGYATQPMWDSAEINSDATVCMRMCRPLMALWPAPLLQGGQPVVVNGETQYNGDAKEVWCNFWKQTTCSRLPQKACEARNNAGEDCTALASVCSVQKKVKCAKVCTGCANSGKMCEGSMAATTESCPAAGAEQASCDAVVGANNDPCRLLAAYL